MLINLSRKSYILRPLKVTTRPILSPSLNLKEDIDLRAEAHLGFWPVTWLKITDAFSKLFLSAIASFTPILTTIFDTAGTAITFLRPNSFCNVPAISFLNLTCKLFIVSFAELYFFIALSTNSDFIPHRFGAGFIIFLYSISNTRLQFTMRTDKGNALTRHWLCNCHNFRTLSGSFRLKMSLVQIDALNQNLFELR